jgi:EAL domain-containing protein (putative c-di-GMP-specific phosphodiesterase class I)
MDGIEDEDSLSDVVNKLMEVMHDTCNVGEHHLPLTLSMGISVYPDDGNTSQLLIRNADTAMYAAKKDGRNKYHFYRKDMTDKSIRHIILVKDIRKAIDNREFVVYYQPQIDANTYQLLGLEALVRWQRSDGSLVQPDEFIKVAESAALIDKIGSLVLDEATLQIKQWYGKGYSPGRLAINCSALEIECCDFAQKIKDTLVKTECKPEWLELEITEGYMLKNPKSSIKMLQSIKDLGIHLSIDDFGTGYSSLSYLKKLPIDTLKIDASFIQDLEDNKSDEAIVESIISLAKTMSFDVIAEGVETQAQEDILIEKGCSKIQGFLYAKPMPAEEMELFLNHYQKQRSVK